jgi:glycosyltransferase involved in cell wall biosynthesis
MKVILFANTDWYLYNFRRDLALALRKRGDEVVLVSPQGEYAKRLVEMDFRWVEFPLSRSGINPFAELGSIYQLYLFYRNEKPALVHHFTVKCVLYGSLAAHWAGVRAIVNSITGLGYLFLPGGLIKNILRYFIRAWYRYVIRGTQVIFENANDQTVFLQFGFIQPEDGHLIPGVGVDTRRFLPTPEPAGNPVVLLAARMLWDKGVGEFVEAAQSLSAKGLQARFALAGRTDPGNPASIPDKQIEAWREEGVIEWWGWSEDMAATLAKVNIFCLPSYYREGLPTVIMETSASGRAVVTTDWPGCRDAIEDGLTGLLVKPRDVPSLAAAIRALVVDSDLRQKMGVAGRALVEEKFSSDKILARILSVYARAGKAAIN